MEKSINFEVSTVEATTLLIMNSCPQGFIRVGEILCASSVFQHCDTENSVPDLEEEAISAPKYTVSVLTQQKQESDNTVEVLSESISMMRSPDSTSRDPLMSVVIHNCKINGSTIQI